MRLSHVRGIVVLYIVCTYLVRYSNCTEDNGIIHTITKQLNMEEQLRTSFDTLFKAYFKDSLSYKTYVIYACDGSCVAGYDNGLLAAFLFAILSERKFAIHPQNGQPFYNDVYDTSNTEWKMTTDLLYNKSMDLVFKPTRRDKYKTITDYQIIKKRIYEMDFEAHFTSDVMILSGNEDIIKDIRRHPRTSCKIPWFFQTHVSDFIRLVHNGLFRVKDRTQDMIKAELIEKVGGNRLSCFVGYQKHVNLKNVVNFLDSKFGNYYKLYLKGEIDYVSNVDIEESDRSKLVNFDIHGILAETIKYSNKNTSVDQHTLKNTIEVHILKFCDVLIIAESTYGVLPAYLRRNNEDLYCYRRSIIFPCIRELISGSFRTKQFYPEPIDMLYFCSQGNTKCIAD